MDSKDGRSMNSYVRRSFIFRSRVRGAVSVVLGVAVTTLAAVYMTVVRFDGFPLLCAVLGLAFVVFGIVDWAMATRTLRQLELERGVGAGKQEPPL